MTNPVPNSTEDFYERLCALQEEARSYGLSSLIGIVDNDVMNKSAEVLVSYSGGWVTCLGIAEYARQRLGIRSDNKEDE